MGELGGVADLKEQHISYEQYFFIKEIAERLVPLCKGRTACLCTPTIAEAAPEEGKDVTLFDIGSRLDALFGQATYVHLSSQASPVSGFILETFPSHKKVHSLYLTRHKEEIPSSQSLSLQLSFFLFP
ncbi:hypothetical protein JXA34_04045 [Patescibacteria group bacterium]|nr:hypothetical protein [Patescibacteria group bacterium]